MTVETTINIHQDVINKINNASCIRGLSRTKIILMLIKKVMYKDNDKTGIDRTIKYQQSDEERMWHKFHIKLKKNDYEYFLDLRRLLKMSVSKILAYAVQKYLNDIINGNNTDNYPFKNYIFIRDIVDDIIIWKLFWGVPSNLEEYLPKSTL